MLTRRDFVGVTAAAAGGAAVAGCATNPVTGRKQFLLLSESGEVDLDRHTRGFGHLREVAVEVGQHLAQGDRIGTVGMTGRATGPHLHWGVYWFERALDPALLVGSMPAALGKRSL